jgi:antitoxin PrlF
MQQPLTSNHIPMEIYSTLTSKGQVTIPAAIRKHLGVATSDKIAFVIQPEGRVEVKTLKYPTMALLAGAAGKLKKPLSEQKIEEFIRDDVAKAYKKKFL